MELAFDDGAEGPDEDVPRLECAVRSDLVLSWGHAGSARLPPGASTVEITLTAESNGTTVRIVHHSLPEADAREHAIGWPHFLDRLITAAAGQDPGPDPWAAR